MWLFLWLSVAVAEADDDADLIIDVHTTEAAARAGLHRTLVDLGYKRGVRHGNKVVYHHMKLWKPSVHIHDDGTVQLKRAPIHAGSAGSARSHYKICWGFNAGKRQQSTTAAVDKTLVGAACLYLDGLFTGARHMKSAKRGTMATIIGDVRLWQQASASANYDHYLQAALPKRFDALWEEGRLSDAPLEPLHQHFCSRLDTDEGAAVREQLLDYLLERELLVDWHFPCAITASSSEAG